MAISIHRVTSHPARACDLGLRGTPDERIDSISSLERPSGPSPKGGFWGELLALFFLALNECEDVFAYSSGAVPVLCTLLQSLNPALLSINLCLELLEFLPA